MAKLHSSNANPPWEKLNRNRAQKEGPVDASTTPSPSGGKIRVTSIGDSKLYNIELFLNKISQKYTSFYGYLRKLLQGTPRLGIFPTYELMKGF